MNYDFEIMNIADVEALFREHIELFHQYNFVITDDYRKHVEKPIYRVYYLESEKRFCVFIDEEKRDILGQMIKDYLISGGLAKDAQENNIDCGTY